MTALLLVALLASGPTAPAARPRADLRVTVTDTGGTADAGLADALARTMAEAGLTASPAHRRTDDCADECVHVSVRKLDERGFLIEVRARREVVTSSVRLLSAASSFDQLHALAIEAELLAERVRPPRRKQAPKALASTQPAPGPSPLEVIPAVRVEADEPPPPISPETERLTTAAAPATASALQVRAQSPAAPTDERLALSVTTTVLAGTAHDLLMHGLTLGLRLRITHHLDASASITGLKAQNIVQEGKAYQLDMFPLTLAAAVEVPGLSSLRVGGGVEGLLVGGEGTPQTYLSVGPLARLEHRYAIRTFALLSSLQVALHPTSWNTADKARPLVTVPQWIIGASIGLEFRLF